MRGTLTLLRDVSLVLPGGQRTGVIGRNGCGKTSLFKALDGELSLDQGDIKLPSDLRCSTMEQETPGSDRTALEFVIDAHTDFREIEQRLLQAEEKGDDYAMAKLHDDLASIDGYDVKNRAEQLLSGLGFHIDQFANPVSTFSGG